jgi:hypothetical protein
MATRVSAAPANDRVRMNMQQVREQQQLNRERKEQLESAAERNAAAREKTKGQYAHVSSRVSAATAAAIASGPAAGSGRGAAAALRGLQGKQQPAQQQPDDDGKITVFVRECDPDGGVFSIFESEVIKQQQVALAQAAAGAGTARGPSAPGAPVGPRSGRAPSNAPPAAAAGRPAPVAFGRGPATAARGAPTTPLQPLPHNTSGAFGATGAAPVAGANGGAAAARGAVPDYLRQRKQQLQDEKDRVAKAMEDEKTRAQYPPGHRPLQEEERQAILSKLAARKKELEADLGRLPLRFDTIAVKNRRQEIMSEMNEVDEAVQKFSVKKQLFVPI